jgi:hypothetical protein
VLERGKTALTAAGTFDQGLFERAQERINSSFRFRISRYSSLAGWFMLPVVNLGPPVVNLGPPAAAA